ncbi:MAG: DUF559 domain-containing protein, partial [Muribaculaceae bacterium]|nr:DUF559 domain-containing protein [Muribaculaceae bacterium]
MQVLKSVNTKLGNTIELIGEEGTGQTLIIGVIHGDEPQGKFLIEEYIKDYPLSLPLSHKGRGNKSFSTRLQKHLLQNARNLRNNATNAEQLLWQTLRAKNFYNIKFRRQQPIGKYIVDFVCFEKKLIIELDGGHHNTIEQKTKDSIRTNFLEQEGFKIIRIWDNEVLNNPDGVCEYIIDSLAPGGRGVGRGVKKNN